MAAIWGFLFKFLTTTETYKKFSLAILIVTANAKHTSDEVGKENTARINWQVNHAQHSEFVMKEFNRRFDQIDRRDERTYREIHELKNFLMKDKNK